MERSGAASNTAATNWVGNVYRVLGTTKCTFAVIPATFEVFTLPIRLSVSFELGRQLKAISRSLVKVLIRRFFEECSGATAIEYGLIASLIGLAIVTSLQALGPTLDGVFQLVLAAL